MRARSEEAARKRKASAIAAYIQRAEIDAGTLPEMKQVGRDAVARQAGQRSPSEKTWALVLGKLERRMAA